MWIMVVQREGNTDPANVWKEEIVRFNNGWRKIPVRSTEETALHYAKLLVHYFNETRKPEHNESAREVVRVFKQG